MSWNLIQWSEQTSNIMATMTYKELLEELKQLNEEQLKKNVAIYDEHLDAKCLAPVSYTHLTLPTKRIV